MGRLTMHLHPFILTLFIVSIILDLFFLIFAILNAMTLFAFIAILLLIAAWLIFEEHRLSFELWDEL